MVIEGEFNPKYIRIRLRCKQWSCPYCAPINAKILKEKSVNALTKWIDDNSPDGFRHGYMVKWLTLTLPGESFRKSFSIQDAEKLSKKNLSKLFNALKRKRGDFEYFWVVEPQKDGFPHYHVMLLGKNISSIDVKNDIERLWRKVYRMGFVKIKKVEGGPRKIASYMTKYMTKALETGAKGHRVYSMSKKLRKGFKEKNRKKTVVTIVEFGRIVDNYDGTETFRAIWSADPEVSVNQNLDDLEKYFERKALEQHLAEMGYQLRLPFNEGGEE